jgi:hypothetical protein
MLLVLPAGLICREGWPAVLYLVFLVSGRYSLGGHLIVRCRKVDVRLYVDGARPPPAWHAFLLNQYFM